MNVDASVEFKNFMLGLPKSDPRSDARASFFELKVGFFNSSTRLGRMFQAVGSYALPGDTSKIRSPIRSTIASALTPGGGGGGGDRFRCPAGYQFGGRFAAGLNACGMQVFEPADAVDDPVPGDRIGAVARASRTATRRILEAGETGIPGVSGVEGEPVARTRQGRQVIQIARNTQIPAIGSLSRSNRQDSEDRTIDSVSSSGSSYLVRRDGFILKNRGSNAALSRITSNPDMEDGVLVFPAGKNLMKTEMSVLAGSNLSKVTGVMKDGSSMSLEKTKKLTPQEKAKLKNFIASYGSIKSTNVVEFLTEIEKTFPGAIKFTGKTPKSTKPMTRIWIKPDGDTGAPRSVPLWVFEQFLSVEAPNRNGATPWIRVKK